MFVFKRLSNAYIRKRMIHAGISPPEDVGVLAVLDFKIASVLRLLLCITEACSRTKKALEENEYVHDNLRTRTGVARIKDGEDIDVLWISG